LGKAPPEIRRNNREHTGFIPYAGGEKPGTKDYYKYGMQNYERMEGLCAGDWWFLGIVAECVVSYSISETTGDCRLETISSRGLWGIESDCCEDYIGEVEQEQLEDLKGHLAAFGIAWDDTIEIDCDE